MVGSDLCKFFCTATNVSTYNFIHFCQWVNSGREPRQIAQVFGLIQNENFEVFFKFQNSKSRGPRLQEQFPRQWMNPNLRFSQKTSEFVRLSSVSVFCQIYVIFISRLQLQVTLEGTRPFCFARQEIPSFTRSGQKGLIYFLISLLPYLMLGKRLNSVDKVLPIFLPGV